MMPDALPLSYPHPLWSQNGPRFSSGNGWTAPLALIRVRLPPIAITAKCYDLPPGGFTAVRPITTMVFRHRQIDSRRVSLTLLALWGFRLCVAPLLGLLFPAERTHNLVAFEPQPFDSPICILYVAALFLQRPLELTIAACTLLVIWRAYWELVFGDHHFGPKQAPPNDPHVAVFE
ncbi:hypothetical protein BX666DRAFT_2118077 [Dichotomocladium elegans]|nr:hypothetical protein BX666DRAFT_2118077 [Dichotomocladium elegans]